MTKTKKAKPKAARARSAPSAEAPTPAPQAAPAVVQQLRPRWDPTIPPRDRNPRPLGELTKTAQLVRGNSYTLNWSDDPVYFNKPGPAVPITDAEFERLSKAVDRIDFADPGKDARTIRAIRKFRFFQLSSGEEIEMPAIPDVEGGPYALSAGDQAQRDALFEGQEHTAR